MSNAKSNGKHGKKITPSSLTCCQFVLIVSPLLGFTSDGDLSSVLIIMANFLFYSLIYKVDGSNFRVLNNVKQFLHEKDIFLPILWLWYSFTV